MRSRLRATVLLALIVLVVIVVAVVVAEPSANGASGRGAVPAVRPAPPSRAPAPPPATRTVSTPSVGSASSATPRRPSVTSPSHVAVSPVPAALSPAVSAVTARPTASAEKPVSTHGVTSASTHNRSEGRAATGWPALDAAIDEIPVYYPGIAHWHAEDKGAWGATDLDTGDIYISPNAPVNDLLSIVEHEYGHALTGAMYGGFYPAEAVADRLFGQHGEYGLEIEADCMARVQGATWTNYTACTNPTWRGYASKLVHRIKLD